MPLIFTRCEFLQHPQSHTANSCSRGLRTIKACNIKQKRSKNRGFTETVTPLHSSLHTIEAVQALLHCLSLSTLLLLPGFLGQWVKQSAWFHIVTHVMRPACHSDPLQADTAEGGKRLSEFPDENKSIWAVTSFPIRQSDQPLQSSPITSRPISASTLSPSEP